MFQKLSEEFRKKVRENILRRQIIYQIRQRHPYFSGRDIHIFPDLWPM